jgi:O-acetyl-ADP-ribose deacetylase (regulator of RNase III)
MNRGDVEVSRVVAEHVLGGGEIVRLVHGDLTEARVDAIVNAANSQLLHGGGVAGAIVEKGGPGIQEESERWVRAHGTVLHDKPAITGAGNLPCEYVIHAVGPVWGSGDEDVKLRAAVTGALELAERKKLSSLALPAISTGIFGFPKERGAVVILDAIIDCMNQHGEGSLREVDVTLIDEPSVRVFAREFTNRWPDSLR